MINIQLCVTGASDKRKGSGESTNSPGARITESKVIIKRMLPTTRREGRNIAPQHSLCTEQRHAYSRIFIRGHDILWLVTPRRSLYAESRGRSTFRLCEILQSNFGEFHFHALR
jgi:hypothetical protein